MGGLTLAGRRKIQRLHDCTGETQQLFIIQIFSFMEDKSQVAFHTKPAWKPKGTNVCALARLLKEGGKNAQKSEILLDLSAHKCTGKSSKGKHTIKARANMKPKHINNHKKCFLNEVS